MKKTKSPSKTFARLRRKAEATFLKKKDDFPQPPARDPAKLIHELQVAQIELQMQNDELRRAQGEIETSRDRYADLYDFARSEEHTSELQSQSNLVCRLLLEKKKT